MLVCLDSLQESENSNSCTITAPTGPPPPVIPDITPNFQSHFFFFSLSEITSWKRKAPRQT
ncbi:hypothetical protein F8388_021217 [Cannabis sativa]|uniref:Uncharacterized protein n=1 Tax=Cannabis sativa TaxID=3483 RepID=A0A7J6GHL9_CANSA|nr:hypothetical protein F8388_021217 [Cannabis sativa]